MMITVSFWTLDNLFWSVYFLDVDHDSSDKFYWTSFYNKVSCATSHSSAL